MPRKSHERHLDLSIGLGGTGMQEWREFRNITRFLNVMVIICLLIAPLDLASAQNSYPPPTPETFSQEMEQTRASQAMKAVLEKYLDYWGPRYQASLAEVTVKGNWALGVAEWQSQASTLKEPVNILAHLTSDGSWQALLPGTDGAYMQWLEAIPTSLVTTSKKSQLRTQAVEADSLQRSQDKPELPIFDSRIPLEMGEQEKPVDKPAPTAGTQENPCITGFIQTTFLDGVNLQFCLPFKPDHSSSAEEDDWVQTGVWITVTPYQELSIYAIPYGVAPAADNLPISSAGISDVYRQATLDVYKNDAIEVMDGPSITIFGTIVTGKTFLLVNKNSINPFGQRLVTEWIAEAGSRIWIVRSLLDGNFSEDSFKKAQLDVHKTIFIKSQTLDNPSTSLKSHQIVPNTSPMGDNVQALGDLPFPNWWNGDCDMNNFPGSYALGGIYRGVKACGPLNSYQLVSFGAGVSQYEWQCPELPKRYLYLLYGIAPKSADGINLVNVYDNSHPNLKKIANGTANSGLAAGDIISYNGPTAAGHTAIISSVSIDGSGNGSYTTIEQNSSSNGARANSISNWYLNSNSSISVYLHDSGSGGGGSCSAPPLFSPPDGSISSSQTINFSWSAVSGCTFNGYTFRIKDTSNMDSGGTTIVDTGVGGTSWTSTIGSAWNNRDLYWGVKAANAPSGANWAVRRFRIEPGGGCNPNSDQVALYADTGYGGSCVTLGIGDYPNPGYLGNVGNDNVESIRVGSNVQAFLYEHDNYNGRAETFNGDDSNLGDNNIGGNAVSSVKVQSRTQTPSAPTLSHPVTGNIYNEGDSFGFNWNSASGANEYLAEFWGGPAGNLNSGWQSGTSWYIGPQWAGYTYYWHVKARNGAGEGSWSDTWYFTVRPASPSNLSAQTTTCSQINLYWSDNSGNEEGYKIYRNGNYISQVGSNATSQQDGGLNENTTYSYEVRAFRGSIESSPSNIVYITTPTCAPPMPDLVPAQWFDWQYPIVPSSVKDTSVVNTLYAGFNTYIDWNLANIGNASSGGDAYGELYIDSTLLARYNFGNVSAGYMYYFTDWQVTVNTPGWHTLKFVTDPDNLIAESDETNNIWEHQFYWTTSAPYADNMENGINDWTATGLWHQVDANSPYPESYSWSHSWWYGQDSTGNYNTGAANSGDLTSPSVYIPSAGYYLRFWYQYETESPSEYWDQRWVQISVDGGAFTNILQLTDDPMHRWLQSPAIDLTGYVGHTIQIRFHFDTIDDSYNDFQGWYIDDFSITTTTPPTCSDGNEPNNSYTQAMGITYGQSISADICPGGDFDYYAFSGLAGEKIVVDIDARVDGSLLDSYAILLDSDGTKILAENDDEIYTEVQDSLLGYSLPHDGTYYVKMKAWNHPSVGGPDFFYTIHLFTDDVDPSSAEITSPSNDAWLDPAMQTVNVSANDNESGINRVEFLWHSADWENSDWVWLGADMDGMAGVGNLTPAAWSINAVDLSIFGRLTGLATGQVLECGILAWIVLQTWV
jgi:hypothetical protein